MRLDYHTHFGIITFGAHEPGSKEYTRPTKSTDVELPEGLKRRYEKVARDFIDIQVELFRAFGQTEEQITAGKAAMLAGYGVAEADAESPLDKLRRRYEAQRDRWHEEAVGREIL